MSRCATCNARLRLGDPATECVECWARRTLHNARQAAHGCHDDPDDGPPPADWWDYAAYAGIAVFLAVAAVGLGMCWEALT